MILSKAKVHRPEGETTTFRTSATVLELAKGCHEVTSLTGC